MTLEQLERRLKELERSIRGADYVREQDDADEAEKEAPAPKAKEKE